MKHKALDDLELYEVLVACFPEKFDENGNSDIWDEVMDFADEISGGNVDELCDLLGRMVMLNMPQRSAISGKVFHAVGNIDISDGKANMIALVKREVE